MRFALSLLFALYLPFASATPATDAQKSVTAFYRYYLPAFDTTSPPEMLQKPEMRSWVTEKLLTRIATVYEMPEQEILEADYFTYTQDYSPDWIPQLKTAPAKSHGDSQVVDVWLGVEENKSHHLQVWTRNEAGAWKIWRVVDITDNFEQKLY
ncbi:DUF3828 domain-containing protein [Kosakonia sacchari]|uniref:DUF3828 domain-containing protein n=1 Tax=Kosakonia sacchari TaxID=1158459 RepID=UPI001584FE3B|nr:DUF3828 domain-containing protein [Kosakonia sacchari]NUL36090.1 DUF3828 domain-containing protein [Kosakonia sacchari]